MCLFNIFKTVLNNLPTAGKFLKYPEQLPATNMNNRETEERKKQQLYTRKRRQYKTGKHDTALLWL